MLFAKLANFRMKHKLFFLEKPKQKLFSSYTLATHGIQYIEFGSISTTFWPKEKDRFLKFLIREIQRVPYGILTFLLGSYSIILFVLQSNYKGDTSYRVWFNLNNFLTQWKWTILKIPYSRNSKSSVWNAYEILTFLLGKL